MSMMVDRIGSMDPVQPGKKNGRLNQVDQMAKTDSISFSSVAIERSRLDRAIDLALAAPDVRADRVAELRAKINDPSYINDRIVEATADKILESFGF